MIMPWGFRFVVSSTGRSAGGACSSVVDFVSMRGSMRRLAFGSLVIAGLLAGTAGDAKAQNAGFAVNRFEPSERGSHWFVRESLDFRGNVRPAIGVVGDYQYKPLVIYNTDGSERSAVVKHML